MGVGDSPLIAETLARAGEIVELDDERSTVSLRSGNKAPPYPAAFSLIPGGPIDTRVLREAVYRYAEAVIAGRSRYNAITSFLKKQPPTVGGIKAGQPIIEGSTTVEGAVMAICGLENSYMLVQGPPGAGKTFTASRAIVDLLAQGKRVGVSSNSHKAINTLLKEVEELAMQRKLKFRGVKKCSDDDHRLGGHLIEDVTDNKKAVSGNYNLIAGTAWLFARDELDQALDYVFQQLWSLLSTIAVVNHEEEKLFRAFSLKALSSNVHWIHKNSKIDNYCTVRASEFAKAIKEETPETVIRALKLFSMRKPECLEFECQKYPLALWAVSMAAQRKYPYRLSYESIQYSGTVSVVMGEQTAPIERARTAFMGEGANAIYLNWSDKLWNPLSSGFIIAGEKD